MFFFGDKFNDKLEEAKKQKNENNDSGLLLWLYRCLCIGYDRSKNIFFKRAARKKQKEIKDLLQ